MQKISLRKWMKLVWPNQQLEAKRFVCEKWTGVQIFTNNSIVLWSSIELLKWNEIEMKLTANFFSDQIKQIHSYFEKN